MNKSALSLSIALTLIGGLAHANEKTMGVQSTKAVQRIADTVLDAYRQTSGKKARTLPSQLIASGLPRVAAKFNLATRGLVVDGQQFAPVRLNVSNKPIKLPSGLGNAVLGYSLSVIYKRGDKFIITESGNPNQALGPFAVPAGFPRLRDLSKASVPKSSFMFRQWQTKAEREAAAAMEAFRSRPSVWVEPSSGRRGQGASTAPDFPGQG